MTNSCLSWMEDKYLEHAVAHVYQQFVTSLHEKTLTEFEKNKVDPFSTIFEIFSERITPQMWLSHEVQRQAQKSMTNAIGQFHEMVLGSCLGWENLPTGHESGVDIMKTDGSIYAELKNKHNTIKGDTKPSIFTKCMNLANQKPHAIVYLVHIMHVVSQANTQATDAPLFQELNKIIGKGNTTSSESENQSLLEFFFKKAFEES